MNHIKFALNFLLAFALVFGASLAHAQSGGGIVPTLDRSPNFWTGVNTYDFGNLQFNSAPPSCPAGQYVMGESETFTPICGTPIGAAFGAVVYPGQCQTANAPSWCTGTTAADFIVEACAQLPAAGGVVNLSGLHGILDHSVVCSTPTKQVIMLTDPTQNLTVTESDGGIVFPLDEYSMLLGPGNGACLVTAGIHLFSTTNITAVVGPAHTDGTQESFTANGLCILGATGATVTKGLIYAKQIFTNTQISSNNLFECNNSCAYIDTVGGEVTIQNNWFDVGAGNSGVTGSDIIVTGESSDVDIGGNTMEHANGGVPEIVIQGNGAGLSSSRIHIHHGYSERIINSPYTPDVTAISITDCQNCSVDHYAGQGTTGGTNFIQVSQTGAGRTANVEINNILATAWTNLLKDNVNGITVPQSIGSTIAHYVVSPGYSDAPCSPLAATPGIPYTGQCWTDPTDYRTDINTQSGLQQFAWLSDVATVPHSVGLDAMAGAGSFTTGSANFGTNFSNTGCLSAQGYTCTFTRTSSTAPTGYTFSQEIQITANTDPSIGFNGVQYGTPVAFTAGQAYVVNFYAKGDGTFPGTATFLLWNSTVPVFYCQAGSNLPLTTAWTLYSFVCVPSTSGTSNLAIAATTPSGATGTFWLAGFTFTPSQPLTPGYFTGAVAPYGISNQINGTSISVGAGAPTATCGTSPTGSGSLYLRTDGGASTSLYSCAGTTWTAVTIP